LALKSFVCSEPFTTWGEATVFLPINPVDAAYVVPVNAMNSANIAIAFLRTKRRNPLVIRLPFYSDEPLTAQDDSVPATGRQLVAASSAGSPVAGYAERLSRRRSG
jgi:hypothetical protein